VAVTTLLDVLGIFKLIERILILVIKEFFNRFFNLFGEIICNICDLFC